ncbi:MAG TPA: hypothetical protein PLA65_00800 [Spirochaetota bacterium]|nr:hypothetical protein [Spirochaetota bacterium]HOD15093.1 hypothetical protein [Spirochaetota bacterium]HPG52738.1 hypothetical protein [Spirochaetota bacterium]HPN10570.1 hypothetical protein [Spirochaetota bacterium]
MTVLTDRFTEEDIRALEPNEKVALVATVNPEGLPHITLITSLQAMSPDKMVLGEFSRGLSKDYMQKYNKVGFLIMTLDRRMCRGTARWTHLKKEGPEYEMMNEKPMFRYNTYFGVNTVHYFDLVSTTAREGLPMGGILISALKTTIARGSVRRRIGDVLKPFALSIIDRIDTLKFISYVNPEGYPVIVPLIQCRAADSGRLAFSPSPYGDELAAIPKGATVAVFAMTMKMEDILVRGMYNGVKRRRGVSLGTIDIEWAYNSMTPAHGQIYPETALEPVTHF